MERVSAFSKVDCDPEERTNSETYFALIDIAHRNKDLLIKLDKKDMSSSKIGAFLFQFDHEKYHKKDMQFISINNDNFKYLHNNSRN